MSVDHLAAMRANILEQFAGLPNLDAFVQAYAQQFNDIEEALGQLQAGLPLATATGFVLDLWGIPLNQARQGLSDSDYLDVLQSRVVALHGEATSEDLINIVSLIGRPTFQQLNEFGHARVQIVVVNPNPITSLLDLKATLLAAKPAGVLLDLNTSVIPVFRYDVLGDPKSAGYDVGHYITPV